MNRQNLCRLVLILVTFSGQPTLAASIEELEATPVRTPAQSTPPAIPADWKPTPPELFLANCQPPTDPAIPTCKLPFTEPNVVAYEDANQCGDDRNYLKADMDKISDAYKLHRNKLPEANFPPVCIVYGMRNYDPMVYTVKVPAFGSCTDETGFPKKGHKLPCVTKQYSETVYNAFVDVMDCLAINQKEVLPKLWNESGFHVNSVNASENAWDGGVGQLTSSAIRSALIARDAGSATTELDYYIGEMKKSGKASCQRILAEPSAFKVVPSQSSNRCALLDPPANPLRNLLYMGIYYRTMVEQITGVTYRAGEEYFRNDSGWVKWTEDMDLGRSVAKEGIKQKMQKLGIQKPSSKYLRQILVTLGFNAGQDQAVSLLNSYLDARIKENLTLSDTDLDFMNTDTRGLRDLMIAPPGETSDQQKDRLAKLDARRKTAHREPLPIYMRISQLVGSPGYLSVVSFFRAKKYDRELGVNLCTEHGFMQHSY